MRLRHLVNRGILVNKDRFHPKTQIIDALIKFGVNNDFGLVKKADDVHFAGALGADKRICFIDLADKVRRWPI